MHGQGAGGRGCIYAHNILILIPCMYSAHKFTYELISTACLLQMTIS